MKIALIGYGKMGKEIEQVAIKRGHEITAKVDVSNAATFTAKELAGSDVAIEFSTPESAVNNIYKCFEARVPVVVGTTGWLKRLEEVQKECTENKHALFYASNFSIGVNLFFRINVYLARLMNNYPDYDVSIKEIHHIHKLDAPRGPGLSLANQVIENIARKEKWVNAETKNGKELSIISEREGEVPGTHIIKYRSEVDEITITHEAFNRKGFALGAVLAAEFMKGKTGVFGMKDLLNI